MGGGVGVDVAGTCQVQARTTAVMPGLFLSCVLDRRGFYKSKAKSIAGPWLMDITLLEDFETGIWKSPGRTGFQHQWCWVLTLSPFWMQTLAVSAGVPPLAKTWQLSQALRPLEAG